MARSAGIARPILRNEGQDVRLGGGAVAVRPYLAAELVAGGADVVDARITRTP